MPADVDAAAPGSEERDDSSGSEDEVGELRGPLANDRLHQAFLRLGHLIVDHLPRSPTFLLLCAAFSALEPAVWSRE